MLVTVSGNVVKSELRPPREARGGGVEYWWDAWIGNPDPTQAADRISGRLAEATPQPVVGEAIVAVVSVSARSGNYGAYLSAVAREVETLSDAEYVAA